MGVNFMQRQMRWGPQRVRSVGEGCVIHHVRSRIEQQLLFLCFIAARPPVHWNPCNSAVCSGMADDDSSRLRLWRGAAAMQRRQQPSAPRPPVLQQLVEVAGKVGVQALVPADHLIAEGEACSGAQAASCEWPAARESACLPAGWLPGRHQRGHASRPLPGASCSAPAHPPATHLA